MDRDMRSGWWSMVFLAPGFGPMSTRQSLSRGSRSTSRAGRTVMEDMESERKANACKAGQRVKRTGSVPRCQGRSDGWHICAETWTAPRGLTVSRRSRGRGTGAYIIVCAEHEPAAVWVRTRLDGRPHRQRRCHGQCILVQGMSTACTVCGGRHTSWFIVDTRDSSDTGDAFRIFAGSALGPTQPRDAYLHETRAGRHEDVVQ